MITLCEMTSPNHSTNLIVLGSKTVSVSFDLLISQSCLLGREEARVMSTNMKARASFQLSWPSHAFPPAHPKSQSVCTQMQTIHPPIIKRLSDDFLFSENITWFLLVLCDHRAKFGLLTYKFHHFHLLEFKNGWNYHYHQWPIAKGLVTCGRRGSCFQ